MRDSDISMNTYFRWQDDEGGNAANESVALMSFSQSLICSATCFHTGVTHSFTPDFGFCGYSDR